MLRLLHRYATPLITGLFLVSLVSGVALFLGVGQGLFHEMHEVLSMVLILPFALHLWRNWRAMTGYLRHAPMAVALGLSAVLAGGFALSGSAEVGGRGEPPQFALADAVLGHSVAEVAPLVDATPAELTARLAAAGFTVSGPDETLDAIATASSQDSFALIQALLPQAG